MTAPVGIVLAAGEGRRMGGPKALLLVDGRPLISSHVEGLERVGCEPIVVVVRRAIASQVGELLASASTTRVCTVDTDSMAASLGCALSSVSPDLQRLVVVAPVDTLPSRRTTLDALLRAAALPNVNVATPRYQGRGGHPVVARESLLQTFREGYSGTLRELLHSAEARRHQVDVDDAAVVSDLNTPDDLASGSVPQFA